VQLVPDIEPLLQAPTADERAASARALGRLGVKQAKPLIQPLLQDPVQDVRKAAQTALRSLGDKEVRPPALPATRLADGARSWSVGETNDAGNENDWKARLRAMMGE
jgi:HEAT repeat protein